VSYEWGRLLRVVLTVAALVGFAELAVPTAGAVGLLLRVALFGAYPIVLLGSGFFTAGERVWLAKLRHPGAVVAGIAALREKPPAVDGSIPEVYEVERFDEDARL